MGVKAKLDLKLHLIGINSWNRPCTKNFPNPSISEKKKKRLNTQRDDNASAENQDGLRGDGVLARMHSRNSDVFPRRTINFN